MATIVCPECEKDDMIQKVSAMYSSGISTFTPLAQKLAPPAEPQKPSPIGCMTILSATILSMLGGTFCQLIFGNDIFSSIVGIVVFVWFLVFSERNVAKKREAYNALMPLWTQRKAKWNELYYCARNDCVFYPNEGKAISADSMNELIYR
jgi:hypothetical protein